MKSILTVGRHMLAIIISTVVLC